MDSKDPYLGMVDDGSGTDSTISSETGDCEGRAGEVVESCSSVSRRSRYPNQFSCGLPDGLRLDMFDHRDIEAAVGGGGDADVDSVVAGDDFG
mgnify:CR=1 FL=1